MDIIVDLINLIFAFVGIYFTILLLLLFFKYKKRLFHTPKLNKFPSLSIIIPAYNEEKTIKETIENIKNLSYPKKKEIIVVDDGSKDSTYELVKRIKGIKVFAKENGGKASALNLGLKKARGEIVACIDSDSYPERDALLKSIPFFSKNVASVTTSVLVKNAKTLIQRLQETEYMMISWSRKLFEFLNAIYVTPGPMSLYKRKVLLEVGGFDEKNLTEDIEIAWRLMKHKYKIKMALDTKVYTNVPKTIGKWWKQRVRWNIGGLQTTSKYFNLFLDKEFGNLGMFLLPVFSISYSLTFLGLIFMLYILFNFAYFIIGSYAFGFHLIGPIYLIPDLFWLIGFFALILSLVYLRLNFKTMSKVAEFPKRILDLFMYLVVYVTIFPFNLLHSTIKFLMKKYEW
jgi:cellulose synthase/poly-beta-1,6-N-acetylglucosamine synthase-like glycosyltransferase